MKTRNPFPYSFDNKRYHTLAYDNQRRFGCRVFKAVVDAGFTCPNLDGTKGFGGCTYCLDGASEFTAGPGIPVKEQLRAELRRIRKKYPHAGAVAYFQSHTNTYGPLSTLKALFESALEVGGICGLSIATRADALEPEAIAYLAKLSKHTSLTVELGLQTVHDQTAERINRCHTWQEFLDSYLLLKAQGIRVCVHLINGLPGETEDMMLESAQKLGQLRPDGVKLHLLHIMEGTVLAEQYRLGEVAPMEKERYLAVICSQLELLPAETVLERLTGDGSREKLLAPRWSLDKISVLGGIDQELCRRDSMQGLRFSL